MQVTIWKRETSNTRPRGFGNRPTYHFDEPHHSDAEMIWVQPLKVELPEGYEVAECQDGSMRLYDKKGEHVDVFDRNGSPAIMLDNGLLRNLKKVK